LAAAAVFIEELDGLPRLIMSANNQPMMRLEGDDETVYAEEEMITSLARCAGGTRAACILVLPGLDGVD